MNLKSASAHCPKVDTVNLTKVYVDVKHGNCNYLQKDKALPTY